MWPSCFLLFSAWLVDHLCPLRNFKSNLQAVLEAVEGLGYEVSACKLMANNYGLPQRRCRYYFVAVMKDAFAEHSKAIVEKVRELLPKLAMKDHPLPDVTTLASVQNSKLKLMTHLQLQHHWHHLSPYRCQHDRYQRSQPKIVSLLFYDYNERPETLSFAR